MPNTVKKLLTIVVLIAMAMSISMPAFASVELGQETAATSQNEIVLDFKNTQPGTIIYQDEVYLLADGSMVNSYEDVQKAEARGIPFIDVLFRQVGYECWYDDVIVLGCYFTSDANIISYVHSYFYAQDETDLIPDDSAEAAVWAHDYAEEDGVYYSPTKSAYITARLTVPERYTLRIGLFDTYVETTHGYKNFDDKSTVIDR